MTPQQSLPISLARVLRGLGFLLLFFLSTVPVRAADSASSSLTIGMSAPMSGPNGAYGQDMRAAIEAAFAQVNRQGGIHGRTLKLVALDDGYETQRSIDNSRQLIQQHKAFALLAYYGSTPTHEALHQVIAPAGVPLVGTISGASNLRTPVSSQPENRFMFHVRASYADETAAIVNQLVAFNLDNIAIVYQNDGFGSAGLEGAVNALQAHGLTPSAVATVKRNEIDVQGAVDRVKQVNPQAVILITLYKPTAAFVRGMHRAGQHPMFMTLSSVGADQLAAELGDAARGIGITQVTPSPWNDVVPVVREYQQSIGQDARRSYYGLEAFLMAKVLIEGLKQAGKDPSRDKLMAALNRFRPLDLGGYTLRYDPEQRIGSRFVEMTVIGPNRKILK